MILVVFRDAKLMVFETSQEFPTVSWNKLELPTAFCFPNPTLPVLVIMQ